MWTYILAFWYFSYYWILIKFNCLAFNMHLTISSCLDIDHHQHKNRILNMRFRNKMQIWQDKKEFPTSSLNDSITDKNLKYYSPARKRILLIKTYICVFNSSAIAFVQKLFRNKFWFFPDSVSKYQTNLDP